MQEHLKYQNIIIICLISSYTMTIVTAHIHRHHHTATTPAPGLGEGGELRRSGVSLDISLVQSVLDVLI